MRAAGHEQVMVAADPGSFRDPLSRVYVTPDAVWRGLSTEALQDFDALESSAFFPTARERGDIVATARATPPTELAPQWAGAIRHERIDVLSYPYEWPFEMLRDAARLQLSLTRAALGERIGVAAAELADLKVAQVGEPHISMHLMGGTVSGTFAEIYPEENRDPFWHLLYPNKPAIENGHIRLPDKPGLGFSVDLDAAEQFAVEDWS
jgi:hypothetical protein